MLPSRVAHLVFLGAMVQAAHAQSPDRPSREDLQVAVDEAYKAPIVSAREDCKATVGQQPYNVCLGEASEALEHNYEVFYKSLRLLLAPRLAKALADSETPWRKYREQVCDAAYRQYEGGTAAPAEQASCYLEVTRSLMRILYNIYGPALHR